MNEKEIARKSTSGAVKLTSSCPERALPDLSSLVVRPAQLQGSFPADIFEGIETDVVIGEKTAKDPLTLLIPAFVPGSPYGEISKSARLAMAYGTALAGTAFGTGEGDILPEEREIDRQFRGKVMVSWGPSRRAVSAAYLRSGDAVVIELCGTGRGATTLVWKAERTSPALAQNWGLPLGLDWVAPPSPLDLEFPEDLAQHVCLMREVTGHRVPVIVKLGAARVREEVKLAVEAGADAVWVEALEAPLYSVPEVVAEEVGMPLLSVFAPARRALEETGAREKGVKFLLSGGMSSGAEVFKALALGADAVGVAEGARVALGCGEGGSGNCHLGKCPAGIATLDPHHEAKLDWKLASRHLANYLTALADEVKLLAAASGHSSLRTLSTEDLRALTYDAASLTGVKLAGYERPLPMWMH